MGSFINIGANVISFVAAPGELCELACDIDKTTLAQFMDNEVEGDMYTTI